MIYRDLLQGDFDKLPAVLRTFHASPGKRSATGTATVKHHSKWLAWLLGFPPAGEIRMRLDVAGSEDEEIWTRWFGTNRRCSTQRVAGRLLLETAGPVRISFQLRASEAGMQFESRRARCWGIPLPLRIEAATRGRDSGWEMEVNIAHVGSYCGVMTMTP